MILHHLREQTQAHHKRLESRLDLLPATLSLDRYCTLLARFYGFYAPVEMHLERIFQNSKIDMQMPQRRKVDFLIQDLAALGLTEQQRTDLPLCTTYPTLLLLPQALGCLYVLEGATLGGQIISRHLKNVHNLGAKNGAAFFQSYGSQVGSMWRAFGVALISYSTEHSEEDAMIIDTACETFATLESWLCDG